MENQPPANQRLETDWEQEPKTRVYGLLKSRPRAPRLLHHLYFLPTARVDLRAEEQVDDDYGYAASLHYNSFANRCKAVTQRLGADQLM
jgi:hypothetical protein